MSGGMAEVVRDVNPLVDGTHKGTTGTTLIDNGKYFSTFGVQAGLAVRNITQGTSGHVVSATEKSVVTDISFDHDDEYEIYCTTTYNSKISTIWVDRLAGRKVTNPDQLKEGRLPEDEDLDDDQWSPGTPF